MPIPNPSCAVALPSLLKNATDVAGATGNATATEPNARKPASIQELRVQLRAQLARNQSTQPAKAKETELRTELRTIESEAAVALPGDSTAETGSGSATGSATAFSQNSQKIRTSESENTVVEPSCVFEKDRERNSQLSPEVFQFSPPGDRANDAEAVAERAAIMAVENGWNDARALQEARWAADRERCWRGFLLNAQRVLDAPAHRRGVLLAQYQQEAIGRYGEEAGMTMAGSLRAWVKARAVH